MQLGRLAVASLALLVACGSAPLARHARELPVRDEASTLDASTRAYLEASLADLPTRESVRARRAFLDAAPTSLSSREARDLLASTLAWVQAIHDGWRPTWPDEPCGSAPRDERARPPLECIGQVIRESNERLERASLEPHTVRAWRAAMIELHGTTDECSDVGEEGAVAAAVRYEQDRNGSSLRVDRDSTVAHPDLACHVATLDGGARIVVGSGPLFVRSCWDRGGPPERACAVVSTMKETTTYDFSHPAAGFAEGLPDSEVVVVLSGSTEQAFWIVVVHRDGVWRVVRHDLAWTT